MEHKPIPSELGPPDKRFEKLEYHNNLPKPPFNLVVAGSPGSGKSSFAYTLVNTWFKKYFDEFVAFVQTKDSHDVWEKVKQRGIFVGEYTPEKFQQYLTDLEKTQLERKKKGKFPLRVCILFDDYASKNLTSVRADNPLTNLALNHRHLNISIVFATQKIKTCLTPVYRNSLSHLAIFRIPKRDVMAVAEDFSEPSLTPKEFADLFYPHIQEKNEYLWINMKKDPYNRFALRIDRPVRIDKEDDKIEVTKL